MLLAVKHCFLFLVILKKRSFFIVLYYLIIELVMLVLAFTILTIFCEKWIFSYWKCRADIAACVAQAWKRNNYVSGKRVTTDLFSRLLTLKLIPDSERDNTTIRGQSFHAEDLTIHPDFYTQGLAEGQFGKDCALGRWLEHYERGLMGSGFGDYSSVFKHTLKISSLA